jgi:hypothetical protein
VDSQPDQIDPSTRPRYCRSGPRGRSAVR